MKRHRIWPLAILLTFAACRPLELERPNVPVFWGMRFDTPAAETELSPNLAKLRELVMRELALELPLRADSLGLPSIPPLPLAPLKGLVGRYKVGLHISFAPSSVQELFPEEGPRVDPERWFAALEQQIDSTLRLLEPSPVTRVVIGSRLKPMEQHTVHWAKLIANLKQGRETYFSYGTDPDGLQGLALLPHCDEIAVDYPPSGGGEDLKAISRRLNQQISHLADSLQKPVYIFRANLMGEGQAEQFQNRLRFWNEGTRLRGIAINTLYAKTPMRDSTSYYGLMDNPDFSAFLKSYRQREE